MPMQIEKHPKFHEWMEDLRDDRAIAKIAKRIDMLALGNPGDVAPVGEGISELKIDYGPGYRVYYRKEGLVLYFLLCGGDKSTQDKDIAKAKKLAAERDAELAALKAVAPPPEAKEKNKAAAKRKKPKNK